MIAMNIWIIILRLFMTFLLSFVFGFERQKEHKPVGFGTYIFVAVGSCAAAMVATDLVPSNPLPLLSAIISGIGFLGAGAIMKTSEKVFGFTSAATIWLFAIFGLVVGVGEYFLGCIIYILIGVVVIFDRYLENNSIGLYQKKITITTNKIIQEKEIITLLLLNIKKFQLNFVEVDKKANKMSFTYMVEGNKDQINKIPKKLYEMDWFENIKIE